MSEAVKEFQFRRGNLALMPYVVGAGAFNEEALIVLYKRLKDEDLWDTVFHEDTGVSLLKFMNFFSGGQCLLQFLAIVNDDRVVDIAGMSWIADITICSGVLTRGVGSFGFFKDYQKPMYTDQFSEMILDYWFNALNLDTIVGVTPEPNRAASIFVKRAGFREVGRMPNYTTYKGQVANGIIHSLTKEEYRQMLGG